MKLKAICQQLDLSCPNHCNDIEIIAINDLEHATCNEISFLSNERHLSFLASTQAAAVFMSEAYQDQLNPSSLALVCKNPKLTMAKLSKIFYKIPKFNQDFSVGTDTQILTGAIIGEHVSIGNHCLIYPGAVIYPNTVIGNDCIIHANAVIGSDGFGYVQDQDFKHVKIYHSGNVILEDEVEVGANTCIDKATFGSTIIKKGVKIDNLVQIGHNCDIGAYSVIIAQCGLSGSCTLGENVILAGQVGVKDGVKIKSNTTVLAKSGVMKNINETGTYSGFPLLKHKDWLKSQIKLKQLMIL